MTDKKKILLVDDELEFVNDMARGLEILGYEVIRTANASSAKDACDRARPDLVLADYKLNDANGTDVTQYVKSKWPSVYCVVITAYFEEDLKEKISKLGVDEIIYKPIDFDKFKKLLQKALSART